MSRTLGAFVRAARERKGLQGAELAAELGVSRSYVSDIELDRRVPADAVLDGLARVLEVSADHLYARAGKLDAATRAWVVAHPLAVRLLRRLAELKLDDVELAMLLEMVEEHGATGGETAEGA